MTASVNGKTILVTGAAGFIGSHLARALLDRGARVICVDDYNDFYDPRIKAANVRDLAKDPDRFVACQADIRDAVLVDAIFAQWGPEIDQVVHLAARAGVRPSLMAPQLYLETNVNGTLHMLEAMRRYEIGKMVFASSSSVYGNRTDAPFREDQDISKPISPYAATKVMGENLLHTYSHLYGIQATALRFFTVYGPGQRPDLAIHKFTDMISRGQPIPVFGDGSTMRDYTYIDDILQGIQGAMVYDETPYEVFNLGESEPVSLSGLIAHLEAAIGKKAVLDWQPMQPGDVVMTCADINKARRMLGYNPTTSLSEGLPKFVDYYQKKILHAAMC